MTPCSTWSPRTWTTIRQGLSLRWAVIGLAEKYDDLGSSDRAGGVFVSATMMIDLVVVHIVAMLVLTYKMRVVVGTNGVLLLGMFHC